MTIPEIMKRLQLNKSEFSRILGIDPSNLTRWERAVPLGSRAATARLIQVLQALALHSDFRSISFDLRRAAKSDDASDGLRTLFALERRLLSRRSGGETGAEVLAYSKPTEQIR